MGREFKQFKQSKALHTEDKCVHMEIETPPIERNFDQSRLPAGILFSKEWPVWLEKNTCTFRWRCITLVFCTSCGSLLWTLLFTKCKICEVILFWPLTMFFPGSQCCHFKPEKPLSRTKLGLTASPQRHLWSLMQSLALYGFYSQLLDFGTQTLSLIYIFWIHVCITAIVEVAV